MRRKESNSSFGVLFVLGLIVAGGYYLYNTPMFERTPPSITLETNGYWNLKEPLKLHIEDNSGIKSYKVIFKSSSVEKTLFSEVPMTLERVLDTLVEPPKSAYAMNDKSVKVQVFAQDASKWNFLNGNKIIKEFVLNIDKRKPELETISHSYKIKQGGSAIVIFKASDEHIKDLYIETNFGKKFIPQPFYKDGYFISLIAWPVKQDSFRATIVATDHAGNTSRSYVPLYLKQKSYKISRINISNRFLKGKIYELAKSFAETENIENPLEQFKAINEDIRAKNEKLIHEITSKVPTGQINSFNIKKMYPLKSAIVVASFGDHRKYIYKRKYLSESYHLGVDLASNAKAKIKPQNSGDVVFSDFNGLYGNMPIIHHGLGLYTLYGHCSEVSVSKSNFINAKSTIARTGKSGYAMGDHLHFGVLIQGIEVRPAEWMDQSWINSNITKVIKNAKTIINKS